MIECRQPALPVVPGELELGRSVLVALTGLSIAGRLLGGRRLLAEQRATPQVILVVDDDSLGSR